MCLSPVFSSSGHDSSYFCFTGSFYSQNLLMRNREIKNTLLCLYFPNHLTSLLPFRGIFLLIFVLPDRFIHHFFPKDDLRSKTRIASTSLPFDFPTGTLLLIFVLPDRFIVLFFSKCSTSTFYVTLHSK